jgi:hypothetical protein
MANGMIIKAISGSGTAQRGSQLPFRSLIVSMPAPLYAPWSWISDLERG